MRLFVALPVPPSVRADLESVVRPLEERQRHLRWSASATWHLTLAFLGEVAEARQGDVIAAVDDAVADESAFTVGLGRAGRFGRGVLWLGVTDDAFARIVTVGEAVRSSLSAAGVAFDPKPLHPHLTLARPRTRDDRGVSRSRVVEVDEAIAAAGGPPAWRATEVVVVRSHLGDGPARHETLASLPLGG